MFALELQRFGPNALRTTNGICESNLRAAGRCHLLNSSFISNDKAYRQSRLASSPARHLMKFVANSSAEDDDVAFRRGRGSRTQGNALECVSRQTTNRFRVC